MMPLAERSSRSLLPPLGWALLAGSGIEAVRVLLPPDPGNFTWMLGTATSLLGCAAVWFLGFALIHERLPEQLEWWRLQLHRLLNWLCLALSLLMGSLTLVISLNTGQASTTLDTVFLNVNSQGLVETQAIERVLQTAPTLPDLRSAAEFLHLTDELEGRIRERPSESLAERANWLRLVLTSSHNQFITNASEVLAKRRLELFRDSFARCLAAVFLAAAGFVLWARTRHLAGHHVPAEQGDETAHN